MKLDKLLFILLLAFASACSTTKNYPPEFYGYTPAEQSLIRKGQIAVGFDEDQVRMAWGKPTRIMYGSSGPFYNWHYGKIETRTSVIQDIGGSIARGTDPVIPASRSPFYKRTAKHVVFDSETHKVVKFQSY